MEKKYNEDINNIPIPEGFEERLSMKIDEWERAEKEQVAGIEKQSAIWQSHIRRWMVAAMIVAAIGGVSVWLLNKYDMSSAESNKLMAQNISEKDLKIANDALIMFSENLNIGLGELEKVEEGVDIMNETLENLNKK